MSCAVRRVLESAEVESCVLPCAESFGGSEHGGHGVGHRTRRPPPALRACMLLDVCTLFGFLWTMWTCIACAHAPRRSAARRRILQGVARAVCRVPCVVRWKVRRSRAACCRVLNVLGIQSTMDTAWGAQVGSRARPGPHPNPEGCRLWAHAARPVPPPPSFPSIPSPPSSPPRGAWLALGMSAGECSKYRLKQAKYYIYCHCRFSARLGHVG